MMTKLSARGYTKIRHILVQLPNDQASRTSTVGKLLTARKHRALVLYLMLLMCWPWLQSRRRPLEAAVWVRGLTAVKGLTWSASTLSRAWADLEEAGLITRHREGRNVRIEPRREDGAADYTVPTKARDRWNTYYVLPDDLWANETFATLSFPGLAVLLIIASQTSKKPDCTLPYERAKEWYGLSAKSVQKGVKDLEAHGLIHKREEMFAAPLSPTGMSVRIHYSLTGNYGQQAREALQQRANTERTARTTKAAPGNHHTKKKIKKAQPGLGSVNAKTSAAGGTKGKRIRKSGSPAIPARSRSLTRAGLGARRPRPDHQ
jgi:DNA-binding HxlR family transcriptional regulator